MATIGNLIVKLTADVTKFERSLASAEKSLKNTEKSFARTARRLESIGQSMMIGVTVPLMVIGGYAAKTAIEWEDAFAGVRKTVDATEQQYAELARGLRDMSLKEIPQTAEQLAKIAENAGQLGIQRPAILGFTRTMGMLGDTTNLAGDQAATAMARFDNIMQSGQKSFDRMGSTIVALGNNLATTESEIMEMSMRLAGAGRVIRLTEAQVFAFGGALSSVGIEAEAGGTAMSKLMVDIAQSVATGGKKLDMFAQVAGKSTGEFKTAFQRDAAGAIVDFIEGLGRVREAGGNVFGVIDALGLSEARLQRALLSASGAGDLFRRSLNLASEAWEQNTALAEEAAKRYGTMASKLKFARSKARDLATSLGEGLAPFLQSALDAVEPLINGLRRLAEGFSHMDLRLRAVIVGLVLTVALLGPTLWLFGALYSTMASVITVIGLVTAVASRASFAFIAWRGGAATLGEALVHLVGSKAKLITIGILGLAAAAIFVALNWEKVAVVAKRVWNGISAVVLYSASLVVRGVGAMISILAVLIPALRPAAQAVSGYADTLKASASSAWEMAKAGSAAAGVQQVADAAGQTADAGARAAQSQTDLADAMSETAKAAGKNLQSFDEVHQIQEEAAGTDLGGMLDLSGLGEMSIPAVEIPGMDMLGGLSEQFEAMDTKLADSWTRASAAIGLAWDLLKQKAYDTFPGLETAVNMANTAVDWIRQHWPTIGPIVENIAGVIMVLLVPAMIKTGVEATIAGAKAVASWVAQGVEAAISVGKQLVQWAIAGAKWVWLGVQAVAGAAQAVWAWAVQGWEAAASVGAQIVQFGILVGKWVWLRVQALIEGAKIAGVWLLQKAEAIASVAAQAVQFGILVAKWVWMGVMALASAAQVALAWLIAIGPIALVIAAVVALVALIIIYWDEIKAWTIATWEAVVGWLSEAWERIKATAVAVWDGIKAFFAKWWDELLALVTGPIGWLVYLIVHNWDTIKETTMAVWSGLTKWLSDVWNGITSVAGAVWTAIGDWVTGKVFGMRDSIVGAWTWVSDRLAAIWNGIKIVAGAAWDGIVAVIKAPINMIIGAINRFLGALEGIKISVPKVNVPLVGDVGGFTVGMPSLPRIPMLAEGGNITGRGMAMVGEAGAEILELPRGARVTPLNGGGGDLAQEIAQAVYTAMRDANRDSGIENRNGAGARELVLQIDRQTFARLILPAIRQEEKRVGSMPISLEGV